MHFDINKIMKGVIAGFVATLVLTLIMMAKKMMGIMLELDPIHMMADMVSLQMGLKPNIVIGWVMHFGIGSVAWGGAFAIFNRILPSSSQVMKGIALGIVAWFMMMIGPMPMSGAGFFGLQIGTMAPVMTFMLHIIFGVVLGLVFTKLSDNQNANS